MCDRLDDVEAVPSPGPRPGPGRGRDRGLGSRGSRDGSQGLGSRGTRGLGTGRPLLGHATLRTGLPRRDGRRDRTERTERRKTGRVDPGVLASGREAPVADHGGDAADLLSDTGAVDAGELAMTARLAHTDTLRTRRVLVAPVLDHGDLVLAREVLHPRPPCEPTRPRPLAGARSPGSWNLGGQKGPTQN